MIIELLPDNPLYTQFTVNKIRVVYRQTITLAPGQKFLNLFKTGQGRVSSHVTVFATFKPHICWPNGPLEGPCRRGIAVTQPPPDVANAHNDHSIMKSLPIISAIIPLTLATIFHTAII